jgi:hypothetical protein
MDRVNVIDLNGHVRLWFRSGLLHERDLSRWIARGGQRDNPIHVHSHVEAQKLRVELPALRQTDLKYEPANISAAFRQQVSQLVSIPVTLPYASDRLIAAADMAKT